MMLVITAFLLLISIEALIQPDGACPIVNLMSFGSSNGNDSTKQIDDLVAIKRSESYQTATIMAINHFNLRDKSIVPSLTTLSNCSVYFELPFFPKKSTINTAIQALWELTKNQEPCAVLGPLDQQSARQIQDLCTGMGFPLINQFESIDPEQENLLSFYNGIPMFVRAQAMTDYLHDRLGLNIWQGNNAQVMSHHIRESAEKIGLHVEVFSDQGNQENTRNELLQMKTNGIKTIFLNVNRPSALLNLAVHLDDLKMLTRDYIYILSPDAAPPDVLSLVNFDQLEDSSLSKLLIGALVFDQVDHFLLHPDDSKFLKAWRERHGLLPTRQTDNEFFQRQNPLAGASFVYDAIMSVGIGECVEQSKQNNPFHDQDQGISGISEINFNGASGEVKYEKIGRHYSRVSDKFTVGLYHISRRANKDQDLVNGADFKSDLISTWTESTGWESINNEKIQLPIQDIEMNFLSTQARVGGYTVTGIIWFTCILCFGLLFKLKNEPEIRRAQPFYLKTICLASVITSSSILTITWDEEAGLSNTQLDAACALTPWLFFLGQIIAVTAIFIKLWRVHQVMQYQSSVSTTASRKINAKVFIPLLLTVIFLFLWSLVDPFTWKRQLVDTFPLESYGRCSSNHFAGFFALLAGVICLSNIMTLLFAWISRVGVPKEFCDHRQIMCALAFQLQTWLLASVTLTFLSDSTQITLIYACRVVTILILSLTNVIALVVPKLIRTRKSKNAAPKRVPKFFAENPFLSEPSQDEQTGPTSPASATADRTHGNESGEPESKEPLYHVEEDPKFNFLYEECDKERNDCDSEWLRFISCFSMDSIPPPVSSIEILDSILLEL